MKIRALAYLLAVLPVFLLAASCENVLSDKSGEIVITGEVHVKGSSMFPNVVITDKDNNDWYIENEDKDKLFGLEYQEVKVRGKPEYEKITVSGEDMGVKRYLRDIKILK